MLKTAKKVRVKATTKALVSEYQNLNSGSLCNKGCKGCERGSLDSGLMLGDGGRGGRGGRDGRLRGCTGRVGI